MTKRIRGLTGSKVPLNRRTGWAAALLCLAAACADPVGNEYRDIDHLAMAEEWRDWVVVGSFGPKGPFTLVSTKLCPANQPCNFSHNRQGHTYDGFTDFELMVLRLESPQAEISHVILRGAQKVQPD